MIVSSDDDSTQGTDNMENGSNIAPNRNPKVTYCYVFCCNKIPLNLKQ